MQARRVLLLLGIVLLLTAAATSFVPVPDEDPGGDEPSRSEAEPPAALPDSADPVVVDFRSGNEPQEERVRPDVRVVVTVNVDQPGEVELEGLGLVESGAPSTPAVFDLFTDRSGRFEVVHRPVEGGEKPIGALTVDAGTAGPGG